MKKTMVTLFILAALMFISVRPVFADATIEIQAGTLNATPQAISFTNVTLNGTTQANIAGTTAQWTAQDPTGSGAGWRVTVVAADFTNVALDTIPAANFEMRLVPATLVKLDAESNDLPGIATPFNNAFVAIDSEQTLLSAALDTGMGHYGFTPDFQLTIPANTYAGTYTSAVTVTILSGPEL